MKKRLIVLFTCLLAGAFTFSLSAQNSSVSTWSESSFFTYVVCDGALFDMVQGEAILHTVEHYNNGELQWIKYTFTGTGTGSITDLEYTFKSQEKENHPVEGLYTWTVHLTSDDGGHYKCTFTWDMVNGGISVDKAWCK